MFNQKSLLSLFFIFIVFLSLVSAAYAHDKLETHTPYVAYHGPPPTYVYLNDTVRIPYQLWIPGGLVRASNISLSSNSNASIEWGSIPHNGNFKINGGAYDYFNLLIKETKLGKLSYTPTVRVWGSYSHSHYGFNCYHHWDSGTRHFSPSTVPIKVLPHPINLAKIPEQTITAGIPIEISLAKYVSYRDENFDAGHPVTVTVNGVEQSLVNLGLSFNQADCLKKASSCKLTGVLPQTGRYQITVAASNYHEQKGNFKTNNQTLVLNVQANIKNTPVLKETITPTKPQDYGKTFSIGFDNLILKGDKAARLDIVPNSDTPDWLYMKDNKLIGTPTESDAGRMINVDVRARSNTGGDSNTAHVLLKVVPNMALKPQFHFGNDFAIKKAVGNSLENIAFRDYLNCGKNDEPCDSSLKVVIDKIEPSAPWLSISGTEPTRLMGTVPDEEVGQHFKMTIHAESEQGGDSAPINIPLNIDTNPFYTPRLKEKFILPKLTTGYGDFDLDLTSRIYNCDKEEDPCIFTFDDSTYPHPDWLVFEGNHLKIKDGMIVPYEGKRRTTVEFTVSNRRGGKSEMIRFDLEKNN